MHSCIHEFAQLHLTPTELALLSAWILLDRSSSGTYLVEQLRNCLQERLASRVRLSLFSYLFNMLLKNDVTFCIASLLLVKLKSVQKYGLIMIKLLNACVIYVVLEFLTLFL